jgi:hypothetical protein
MHVLLWAWVVRVQSAVLLFIVLITFLSLPWRSRSILWHLVVFHSECVIVRDAYTFMPGIHELIHQSLCTVCIFFLCCFSSSFGAIGIDWATGRKLQQVERDSQHASRCGKRETRRRPETVATVIGLQMRPLWKRVWFAGRDGPTSQKPVVGQHPVCRSQELQVHVIHRTRRSLRWDSSPTWYPRCVTHTVIFLLRKCLEKAQKMLTSPTVNSENSALIAIIEITVIIVL